MALLEYLWSMLVLGGCGGKHSCSARRFESTYEVPNLMPKNVQIPLRVKAISFNLASSSGRKSKENIINVSFLGGILIWGRILL